MVFSSLLFVFRFLPITLILYYIAPQKAKNTVLFIASLVFYSWGEVRYFPIMLCTILVNYFCAVGIERSGSRKKAKIIFLIAAIVSLGFLFVFKYLDFIIENLDLIPGINIPVLGLTLPLGISFYTFQTLSYTIDVYRGKVPAEHNFIDMAAFVVLFPQLIAGPIVRYTDIHSELKSRRVDRDMLDRGTEDFIIGLGKKVLIANNVGALWTLTEEKGFSNVSTGLAWLALLAYSLQIYFDFSGYSQMAIGLGRLMGFNFPQNFDYPYVSRSATEFWRRWHITLGSWFREYLYFPLGGSRCGKGRQIFNLFVVWACTGLWHGANWNFLCWGLYFFVLLVIEKFYIKDFLQDHRVISHVYMALVIMIGWGLFAVTDITALGALFNRLFIPVHGGSGITGAGYYLRSYAVSLAAGLWFSLSPCGEIYKKISRCRPLRDILLMIVLVLSVAYLVDSTYNPFLYFRF